ncbi:MAG: phosphate acetyltransferase [Boseongicola sp.]|nr:phosphate acetyltransferase [Boseongicola sp.]
MKVLESLRARAKAHPARIVLSEGHDPRIVAAAIQAVSSELSSITLVGPYHDVSAEVAAQGGELGDKLVIEDPETSTLTEKVGAAYYDLRKHKGITVENAGAEARNPLVFSAMMVRLGLADGTVGGSVATTSDTVRAALQVIGKATDADLVSSFFLMVLPEGHPSQHNAMIFSDSGLVIDPIAEELAAIGEQSADSYSALLNEKPQVALLSFSTKGSAKHERVAKVTTATSLLKEKRPDVACDGELQFDAAFVPSVGASKAPGSDVAGNANVMIFPNLDAGNIGYKIAQRIGGCAAIGPILQGLAKPANDLSRGCTSEDVVNMIAVTTLQAAQIASKSTS